MRLSLKLHDSLGSTMEKGRRRGGVAGGAACRLLSPALAGRWQKVHINFETFLKYIFGTLPNRCYAHALTGGAGRLNCEREVVAGGRGVGDFECGHTIICSICQRRIVGAESVE